MSDSEQTALKAGHAPAMKVGGMRVPVPKHHEEKVETPKEEEADADKASATKNVVISGAVVKEKDIFSTEAAKAIHEKPMPTHSAPISRAASNHVQGMTHIQQPRKN